MSGIPDIDPGDGENGIDIAPIDGAIGAAVATGAAVACLSCAAAISGPYCSNCGQKNDDLRRSSFILFKDFIADTFSFDSRMWKTLGLMAASPGLVPTSYSHGKRSRYTPPVRLFLVVSFLFFLALSLTHTMFVAIEVIEKTPAQIASEKATVENALQELDPKAKLAIQKAKTSDEAIVIEGQDVNCDIDIKTRFFVRPQDIRIDEEKWRACSESLVTAAQTEIEAAKDGGERIENRDGITEDDVKRGFRRVIAGVNQVVSNPAAFNAEINAWLPRVMFFMAPVLALILALFIRGRDALFFDHLVLSLYSHATGFAIIGAAIIFGQFGVPNVFPVAMLALGLYLIAALRRAYGRGWIKTVYSALFSGALYLILLGLIVGAIISNQIWRAAA